MTDMDIAWEDKEENRRRCAGMAREAAQESADLILFPEMTLTGFSMAVERVADKENETVRFFGELAEEYRISIGFGYVTGERDGKGRNHFCIVDASGRILMDYVKIHPFTYGGEAAFYEGGDRLVSFSVRDFICGALICYDLRFPEAFQALPQETDAVFVIANWPESRIAHWHTLLCARAIEMQAYVVGVNRTGRGGGLAYTESSAAYAPDGSRVPEARGERNRYVCLDLEARRAYAGNFPVRADRRPDSYHL